MRPSAGFKLANNDLWQQLKAVGNVNIVFGVIAIFQHKLT